MYYILKYLTYVLLLTILLLAKQSGDALVTGSLTLQMAFGTSPGSLIFNKNSLYTSKPAYLWALS